MGFVPGVPVGRDVAGRAGRALAAIGLTVAAACGQRSHVPARPRPAAAPAAFSFAAHVGVVQRARDTTLCLTMADAGLAAGDTVLVVSAGEGGEQGVAVARVEGPRASPCAAPGDERGSVSIENATFYTVRIARGALLGEPAIAVRARTPLAMAGRLVIGDLDGDGRPERFTRCASNEGIHLRVVTSDGGGEVERWHAYFYVPYDLEPTCAE